MKLVGGRPVIEARVQAAGRRGCHERPMLQSRRFDRDFCPGIAETTGLTGPNRFCRPKNTIMKSLDGASRIIEESLRDFQERFEAKHLTYEQR